METRVVSVICDPVGDAIGTNERVCTALVDGLVVVPIGAKLRCFGEDLLVVQFITVSSTYANQIELISDFINEPCLMLSCPPLGIYPPLGGTQNYTFKHHTIRWLTWTSSCRSHRCCSFHESIVVAAAPEQGPHRQSTTPSTQWILSSWIDCTILLRLNYEIQLIPSQRPRPFL